MLRALGWDHPRCMGPMRACAAAWEGEQVAWDARSLAAFGDQPLAEAARGYDLVVIDHPFCGTAARTGCLRPLDDLVDLVPFAADAVGPSHRSYAYAGRQWALAADAACQVAAVRDDLMDGRPVPRTWDDVLDLARALPGRVALPLAPAHAVSSLLTLRRGIGGRAAAVLAELAALGPSEALDWEPPDCLERMAATDSIAFCPLTYGYVTYAGRVRFCDIPTPGAILGGAGLAVSAASERPQAAAAFAAWACSPAVQRDIVARAGGQPASRAVWDDPAACDFYAATRPAIEAAWVRPRHPAWPHFQLAGGLALTEALRCV